VVFISRKMLSFHILLKLIEVVDGEFDDASCLVCFKSHMFFHPRFKWPKVAKRSNVVEVAKALDNRTLVNETKTGVEPHVFLLSRGKRRPPWGNRKPFFGEMPFPIVENRFLSLKNCFLPLKNCFVSLKNRFEIV
jgi:hypothetical protein